MDPREMIHSRRAIVNEEMTRLRDRLAALEQECSDLDVAERVWDGLLANGHVRRPTRPGELEEVIREMILEAGRPMPRSEIVEALRRRGRPVASKDPGAFITMRLKRCGPAKFKNFEPQGWWPADVPCPLMGYAPPEPDLP